MFVYGREGMLHMHITWNIYTHICMHMCMYTYMHIYTYMYAYIYIYIYCMYVASCIVCISFTLIFSFNHFQVCTLVSMCAYESCYALVSSTLITYYSIHCSPTLFFHHFNVMNHPAICIHTLVLSTWPDLISMYEIWIDFQLTKFTFISYYRLWTMAYLPHW